MHRFDPLTSSWLIALGAIMLVFVVLPLVRALAAAAIYAAAVITGRQHWRLAAARLMPRIAHLIGGVVIGTAAVAATPAMANMDGIESNVRLSVDLDRDSAAPTSAYLGQQMARIQESVDLAEQIGGPPSPLSLDRAAPAEKPATGTEEKADSPAPIYVVRSGDTLWDIAANHLDEPTPAEVSDAWKAIWRANLGVIGSEPGLILPGQHLNLGSLA